MTGPEHYRQAEILAENAWAKGGPTGDAPIRTDTQRAAMLATAQVHASLAIAAAIGGLDACQGPISGYATGRMDAAEWEAVTSGIASAEASA